MTTNGWWLHRDDTARRFFQIVAPYVDSDGRGVDEGFSVRISDDMFHDEFRPQKLRNGNLRNRLSEIFYNGEIFGEWCYKCPECAREFSRWTERCPKCKCDILEEYVDTFNTSVATPNPDDPWIYVQDRKHSGYNSVIPTGRGYNVGSNDAGAADCCFQNGLTYLPNGNLMDICCRGSWCEFGSVNDHPLMLLEMAQRFVETKPHCTDCRDLAKQWKRENLKRMVARWKEPKQIREIFPNVVVLDEPDFG
jgi:hypothetical protein